MSKKMLILASLLVALGGALAACSGVLVDPASVGEAGSEAQIAAAVDATLTVVASESAAPAGTPAPQQSVAQQQAALRLPAPVPGWSLVEKPSTQKGSDDAPVTIVEYSDFQCPWCGRFSAEVLPNLAPLIESGQVRFIYKQFPVLGNASVETALVAECAAAQGDFWTMHDWLFANQAQWKGQPNLVDLLLEQAAALGYNADELSVCIEDEATLKQVEADFLETQPLGFRGTPSFVVNGRTVPGFLPWERFGQLVEASLVLHQRYFDGRFLV